ncbi:MAG: branched-chain amino acid ABC transporter permease [Candidatus Hodarchaeota archaeon]
MESSLLPQVFFNGLTMGLIWVLIALGFSLIYSIMKVYNFAMGQVYMLGAIITFYLTQQIHLSYLLSMFVAVSILFFGGVLMDRLFFKPIRGEMHAGFMVSLGLIFVISSIALVTFGEQPKAVRGIFPGILEFSGVRVSVERLVACGISVFLIILLYSFIRWTKIGMAMRAVAQDREAAELQGININFIIAIGMGISSALAGAAGALVAPIMFVDPFIGDAAIFRALVIVLLGGMGSLSGTVLGGLLLGQIESFGHTYLGNITAILVWIMIACILLFRPKGLLGKELAG